MKRLFVALLFLGLVFSCTPEAQDEDNTQTNDFGEGCLAPDVNCNGIPDHEE